MSSSTLDPKSGKASETDKEAMVDLSSLPPSALHSYLSYYDLAQGREDDNFFDAESANTYLSLVATRHFASQPPPKEGEVVVGFLYKCKAKGEMNKSTAHYRLKQPQGQGMQRRMG